jgi:hypothetical protein
MKYIREAYSKFRYGATVPSVPRVGSHRSASGGFRKVGLALLVAASGTFGNAATVISQSGIAFSGDVVATPIGDVIGMEANAAFPVGIDLGDFAFRGAITVGTDVWLLPTDSDEIVVVDTTTGTMTGYGVFGGNTELGKFAGGVYDGTNIWLVPFNSNGVLRVRTVDGGGFLKGDVDLFNSFPAGINPLDAGKFAGGVFADGYVWFVPFNADRVVRLDPADGTMVGFDGWPVGFTKDVEAFWGGVYDGASIWMVPFDADRVVKVNPSNGSMTEVPVANWSQLSGYTLPQRAFAGGTFDGSKVWLSPYDSDRAVAIDIGTEAFTGYGAVADATQWPVGFDKQATGASFNGAVYDGDDVWLVPFEADHLVKVDATTGVMTGYTNFPATVTASDLDKFAGAVFTGEDIYLVPATRSGQTLVRVFDTPVPAVSSIERQTPSAAETNATSVVFRVTFNKSVSGVDTSDFTLTTTGTAAGAIDSVSAASGTTIDVTVDTVSGDGTLRLDLNASGTGIEDDYTNAIAAGFTTGEVYTIDNTAPVITSSLTATGTYKTAFNYTITASGSAVAYGATGLPAGLAVDGGSGAVTGDPTVSGEVNVTITATDAAGNVGSETLVVDVAKRGLTVSGITATDKTYDRTVFAAIDTTSALLVGAALGDTITLDVSGATGVFLTATVGTGKTVQVSGITISGTNSEHYELAQPTASADIESATLTVVGITAADKTYDGSTTADVSYAGALLVGVEAGDTVVLDSSGASGAFVSPFPGLRAVNVSGLAIGGADSGNYTLAAVATAATITSKTLTVTGLTAADKVYDRTTTATFSGTGVLVGVETGDSVALDTSLAVANFADRDVGPAKTVTITGLALSGAQAAGYQLTDPTATAAITAKPLTITGVNVAAKTYDATTTATLDVSGAALVGVVTGDTVTVSAASATATFDTATVGVGKPVTVSGLALGGADAGNYTLTQPTDVVGDVTKATAGLDFLGLAATYDGTAKAVTTVTTPEGLTVNVTYDGGATAPTNAGSYAVVGTISDTNYEGTANGTLVVAKAAATVTITGTTPEFDGSPKPVTISTTPVGLTVQVTYAGVSTVPTAIGTYAVVATVVDVNYAGSAQASLVIGSNSRLMNISARAQVGTGDDILIPGFVVTGDADKRVLVRGLGPILTDFGVTGALQAPTIRLMSGGTEIATNTGWATSSDAAEIDEVTVAVGAEPLDPVKADSALLATVPPGTYTVHLSGVGGTTGVGLVEVYDADEDTSGSKLINVSARAQVGVGEEILIPGFVLGGDGPRRLLVRAVGPGLGQFGVTGFLENPQLIVYQGGAPIDGNDDWEANSDVAAIQAATTAVGAEPLAADSLDAALLVQLEPGAYTVHVRGVGGTEGVALVEVYVVD